MTLWKGQMVKGGTKLPGNADSFQLGLPVRCGCASTRQLRLDGFIEVLAHKWDSGTLPTDEAETEPNRY
jgi:hypothetical protein